MCDTLVAVPPSTADGCVLFGKNSDREPGEAQYVEHLPATRHNAIAPLQCTYIAIPQTEKTHEVLLSRPFWMWGAEMGVNEYGLAIGNEAVWTKLPVAKSGLTGMDLLRVALERSCSAREALELITRLLKDIGQGGECGYRKAKFRYHNSFILADPQEAWVLETAGEYWAAVKVQAVRTISNALSIGREFDLLGEGTFEFARSQGWCKTAQDFDWAECFGDARYRTASGGNVRRMCTHNFLQQRANPLRREDFFAALRDHAGHAPTEGWRMTMPCAHAAWWPTRQSGQTTGSLVSELRADGASTHWLTGTSSPCLSVFKPVRLGGSLLDAGTAPQGRADAESLFWRHERMHRLVLADYATRSEWLKEYLSALEIKAGQAAEAGWQNVWDQHRECLQEWGTRMSEKARREAVSAWPHLVPHLARNYWREQNLLDGLA